MRTKNLFSVFFKIWAVVSAVVLVAVIIIGRDHLHPATGFVLTSEFVKLYATHHHFIEMILTASLSLFFSLFGILLTWQWNMTDGDTFHKGHRIAAVVVMMIMSFITLGFTAGAATREIACNPYVESAVVTDKRIYERRRRHRSEHQYYINFSNGVSRQISSEKYKAIEIGDQYYIIMNGSEFVGYFDADEYTLEVS